MRTTDILLGIESECLSVNEWDQYSLCPDSTGDYCKAVCRDMNTATPGSCAALSFRENNNQCKFFGSAGNWNGPPSMRDTDK